MTSSEIPENPITPKKEEESWSDVCVTDPLLSDGETSDEMEHSLLLNMLLFDYHFWQTLGEDEDEIEWALPNPNKED